MPVGTKEPIPLKGFCEWPVLTIRGAGWYKGTHPSERVLWMTTTYNSGCRVVQRNPSLWKGFVNDHYLQFGVPGGTKGPIPVKGCVKHHYSQFGAPGGTKAEKDHGFILAQHLTLSPHPDAKPLLKQQHQLPIEQRIKYKIACLCYQIISGTAPQYLVEPSQIYVPSRSLHSSSDDRTFGIPTFKRKQHGGRAFRFSAAQSFVFISKVR